jgi:ribosomal protein L37AE/L43A
MTDGLLLCPNCGSTDLSRTDQTGVFACDDCGSSCRRTDDQCPQCGAVGVTQVEQIGFSAPGQSPREAPRKLVRTCDECGYTTAGR